MSLEMLFLLLVYYCLAHSSVHVGALSISNSNDTVSGFEVSTCLDINHCRTLWAIVQSCVATIFACTWVSVHRNMPAPDSKRSTVTLERIWITIVALLAPEWILGWAIRQYIAADEITELLQRATDASDSGKPVEETALSAHQFAGYTNLTSSSSKSLHLAKAPELQIRTLQPAPTSALSPDGLILILS